MNEDQIVYKPSNDNKIKMRFMLSQCNIHESFKEPSALTSVLLLTVYVQCLKYSIDLHSKIWFGTDVALFSFVDLFYYSDMLPSLTFSIIGIVYVLWSIGVGLGLIASKQVFIVTKILQVLFSSLFFKPIIGGNCLGISRSFFSQSESTLGFTCSLVCLILFSTTIILQTVTRYEFLFAKGKMGTSRSSNWSMVSLQLYILANQVSWQCSNESIVAHIVVRDIFFVFHTAVFLLKCQIQEEFSFKLELYGLVINFVALLLETFISIFKIQMGIQLFGILSIGVAISLYNFHYFDLSFELENVNKWTTNEIMISYASKLRMLLRNYDDYYYNVFFLGYVEIHAEKCDNETCPLRNLNMSSDDNVKKVKLQEIIKKIYRDGYKKNPINPELQVEFAIFSYEIGDSQRALKHLLKINESELSLNQLYKLIRLKQIIRNEISEMPNQEFLDLVSYIKIVSLEQNIFQKFDESGMISLQFWSILNEDHPDFMKLYQTGKSRVLILEEIQSLYGQINAIAKSQKITTLYIYYRNLIDNDERIFAEIEAELKNLEEFAHQIVIEDWVNNFNPIMLVSLEEENYGVIIDLNLTCATVFNHTKLSFIGKHLKVLFSSALMNQLEDFMDFKVTQDQPFYINFNSMFCLQIHRKIKPFNSISTGLCLIITLQPKFQPNTCFLVFNSSSKLVTMSSSSMALLKFEQGVLNTECYFDDLFAIDLKEIQENKKKHRTLKTVFSHSRVAMKTKSDPLFNQILNNVFNITATKHNKFLILNFQLVKKSKRRNNYLTILKMASSLIFDKQADEGLHKKESPICFYFNTYIKGNEFGYISSFTNSKNYQRKGILKAVDEIIEKNRDNYGENILTLRLSEGYFQVVEKQQEESENGDNFDLHAQIKDLASDVEKISKVDEQTIFNSRKSFNQFIEKNRKRVLMGYSLVFIIIICCSLYIGGYFNLKYNYELHEAGYARYGLGIKLLGQLAEINRIIHQARYLSLRPDNQTSDILIDNARESLAKLQELMAHYSEPYLMTIFRDKENKQELQSDEFYTAVIVELTKMYNRFLNNGFTNFTGEDKSSVFLEINGNITKESLYPKAKHFKELTSKRSSDALRSFLTFNGLGIVLSFLLTFLLLFLLKKMNDQKIQILSTFLQMTEIQLQLFLEKTECFLIVLQADELTSQKQLIDEELEEDKRSSGSVFGKKKRFKHISFQKSPFAVMFLFFFFAVGFFLHTFALRMSFANFIEYFGVVTNYSDVYAHAQAKVYQKLLDSINATSPVLDPKLSGEINTEILSYERNFFNQHFKTFSYIPSYHKKFANVHTKNLCKKEFKTQYGCSKETNHRKGSLLLITDLIIEQTRIDYSQPLDRKIFISIEMIKKAHVYLVKQIQSINKEFFDGVRTDAVKYLLIWIYTIIFVSVLLWMYFELVVIVEFKLIQNMLKFFPLSLAQKSEEVRKIVKVILDQK